MKKFVLSLALGCALGLGMASASWACPYHETNASADSAAQTAQAQPDPASKAN